MSDDKKVIFSMSGVGKTIPPNKEILKNIYLSFFYGAKIGIIGLNGSGKSSLLESVYLVATTRSFRTTRLDECGRLEGPGFHVAADVGGEGRVRIEMAGDRRDQTRSTHTGA